MTAPTKCKEGYGLCVLPAGHPGWCEVDGGPQDPVNHTGDVPVDLVALFDQLARTNAENGDHARVAAGTFALYPARGGGVVLVLNVEEGPDGLRGTLRKQLGPALIRALQAFGDNGANPFKLVSALAKGRKRDRAG